MNPNPNPAMLFTTQFYPNDIVQLRTGGPLMNVVKIEDDKQLITCSWISLRGELQQAQFTPIQLNIYEQLYRSDRLGPEETNQNREERLLTVDENGRVWAEPDHPGDLFPVCLGYIQMPVNPAPSNTAP
jgi:uncharacterized protein YodC (DUF2158 family)